MNLAIRGITGQITHGDTFHNDRHPAPHDLVDSLVERWLEYAKHRGGTAHDIQLAEGRRLLGGAGQLHRGHHPPISRHDRGTMGMNEEIDLPPNQYRLAVIRRTSRVVCIHRSGPYPGVAPETHRRHPRSWRQSSVRLAIDVQLQSWR